MTRSPAVLMLVENQSAPGDARVWPEALALRDAGYRVSVISPKAEGDRQAPYDVIDGIEVFRYSLRPGDGPLGYLIEYGAALVGTLRLSMKVWLRGRFDVIHTANPPDFFFPLAWLYRPFGVRFVFDQHDLAPETFQSRFEGRLPDPFTRLLRRLLIVSERLTYGAADLVIVTNESFRDVAIERGAREPERVAVVRNGPYPTRLNAVAEPVDLRGGKSFVLAYLGEMSAQDGVEYAIQALDILVHRRGRGDVRLALIGTGTSMPAIQKLTRDLGLEGYVTFLGWVPQEQVPAHLAGIDIGVSPEPRNAMNDYSTMLKVMEYMAAGKPIVAFDLKETRYSAGEAALYAVPNEAESFATQIERLLDDETLRRRMGKAGKKRIADALSWEHSRARLLEAYRGLGIGIDQSVEDRDRSPV